LVLRHPTDHSKYRTLQRENISSVEKLLVDILVEGKLVYEMPDIDEMRRKREEDVERLDAGVRRIMFPHIYHVSLSQRLWDQKQELIKSAMAGAD
jgi:nicotinate phosphoribosyltransferase